MVRGSRIEFLGGAGGNGEGVPGEGHITIIPFSYDSIGQGTPVFSGDSGIYLAGSMEMGSDGDNVTYKVYLDAGTYTIMLFCRTFGNFGIVDIDIDTVEVASFDCYSASLVSNVRQLDTGNVIASAGLKDLRVRNHGKNASSAGYKSQIQYIALWRTA